MLIIGERMRKMGKQQIQKKIYKKKEDKKVGHAET